MGVVIYTRVSTEDQKENGFSLQDQERRIRKYCNEQGFEIIAHYQDDYSAKDFNRPQFQKMLSDLRDKRIKPSHLICLRMDRYSRNLEETIIMTKVLKELKVEVYFIEGNVDLSTPESSILYMLSALLPQVENERRGLNTKQGMRQALRQGKWMWQAPKGYSNNKLNKTIYPNDEAKYIKQAFLEVSYGIKSPDMVRKELNSVGFKCSKQSFYKLLKDAFYTGKILVKAWKDEPEQIVKGIHEAIIDDDLFEIVQNILNGRKRKQPKKSKLKALFPLRGHLICKRCGNNLTASSSKGSTKKYDYYHCQHGCKERISAKLANTEYEKLLASLVVNKEISELYTEALKDVYEQKEGLKEKKILDCLKSILNSESKLKSIDDKLINNTLDIDNYTRIANSINNDIKQSRKEIAMLSEAETNLDKQLKYGISFISHLDYYYINAPLELKGKITSSIFPEKLIFEENNYRTKNKNSLVSLLCSDSISWRGDYKEKAIISDGLSSWAPPSVLFSNQFKEDLLKIYELRHFIDVSINPEINGNLSVYKDYNPQIVLN
jgi:site-specific DNA recombinase